MRPVAVAEAVAVEVPEGKTAWVTIEATWELWWIPSQVLFLRSFQEEGGLCQAAGGWLTWRKGGARPRIVAV